MSNPIIKLAFDTHLIEHGVSLRHIQLLLGHASPKTTEIYTHIANMSLAKIKSTLDRFYMITQTLSTGYKNKDNNKYS